MRTINQDSLKWTVCHPNNLIQTNRDSGIIINGKKFTPLKIKTYMPQYSYDVYENRVVLGFLGNVIDYIDDQIIGFNKEIGELENIPEKIVAQLPNTHELTGRCVYIYYKGVVERFSDKRILLQEIYDKYERVLKCTADAVYGIPKLTNTFKRVYHYRLCYECMVKWFGAGDYSFEHLNYLFKLKTLSRIFEYFCLIKLQVAIMQCGYTFKAANRVVYDVEDDTEDINNQYIFNGQGYELTLLYEPFIWVDKINDGMNLYSTGYNFSKSKWNDRWTPDFVLKISSGYKEYYYILDAKYSNVQNVQKRHIPKLVLKYSTQIASKDKFFSDVIGVGAIYPGDADKMYYFKKNAVNSHKESLPKYFSLTIVGENSGNIALKARIKELLKVIDTLEQESGSMDDGDTLKAQFFSVTGESDNSDEKKEVALTVGNNAIDFPKNNNHHSNKEAVVIVNAKKCFYYAKKKCLYQKKYVQLLRNRVTFIFQRIVKNC